MLTDGQGSANVTVTSLPRVHGGAEVLRPIALCAAMRRQCDTGSWQRLQLLVVQLGRGSLLMYQVRFVPVSSGAVW
jgi:hypothetical protein